MASLLVRKLRSTPTDAETRLWARLRRQQIDGFRFRRQQPIGRYVVDFFCPEAKLIIEVDGGQHANDSDTRTRWFEAQGYCVIRFWNTEVLGNTDGVVTRIREALHAAGTPLPDPPPQGGRESEAE